MTSDSLAVPDLAKRHCILKMRCVRSAQTSVATSDRLFQGIDAELGCERSAMPASSSPI